MMVRCIPNLLMSRGGPFEGMKRFDARVAVEAALQEKGLLRGKVAHAMVLPICSRSRDILEPMLKPQWYVDTSTMAAAAMEAVRSGQTTILPEMHVKTWERWMENIRPWCIR